MSIVEAREALKRERDSLKTNLGRIEKALAALEDSGAVKRTPKATKPKKPKGGPKKMTTDQAVEKYGAEKVTCDVCGFVSTAPQGLSAHKRSNH